MATLQLRNDSYRILFCYRGRRHSFTIGRVDRREAELAAAGVERVLLRLEQGLLELPPNDDIVAFVRRDGRPRVEERPAPPPPGMTLGLLREAYVSTHAGGAIEPSTLGTARTHLGHVVATLGADFRVARLTTADLQRHIARRSQARGRRGRPLSPVTIRKELAGFRSAFHWAVHAGLVRGTFPGKGLVFPKVDEKPPFRTLGEVER